MKKIIKNGRIVTPGGIIEGSIGIDGTKIRRIMEGDSSLSGPDADRGAEIIDAAGCYIMPGLVDFHCDLLEYAIQPRKNVFFPLPLALHSIQAQFLAAGITTIFHPVSFAGEPGLRSNDMGLAIVRAIARFRREETAILRHFIHVRYELNNKAGLDTVGGIFKEGLVELFSVTDHSPGYGKFKTYHEYKRYIEKNSTLTAEQLEAYTKVQWEMPAEVDHEVVQQLLMYVARHHVPFATHDDDSPRRVDAYRRRGATISEFPLNEETARHALNHNMYAVVGAPNLLRNKSHTDNLSARHAIDNGLANILCSDYYCNALLASIFVLFEEGMSLPEAVAYAALNPARAVGLADRLGSLEEGKEADILLVRHRRGELPVVERAMVEGRWRFGT